MKERDRKRFGSIFCHFSSKLWQTFVTIFSTFLLLDRLLFETAVEISPTTLFCCHSLYLFSVSRRETRRQPLNRIKDRDERFFEWESNANFFIDRQILWIHKITRSFRFARLIVPYVWKGFFLELKPLCFIQSNNCKKLFFDICSNERERESGLLLKIDLAYDIIMSIPFRIMSQFLLISNAFSAATLRNENESVKKIINDGGDYDLHISCILIQNS